MTLKMFEIASIFIALCILSCTAAPYNLPSATQPEDAYSPKDIQILNDLIQELLSENPTEYESNGNLDKNNNDEFNQALSELSKLYEEPMPKENMPSMKMDENSETIAKRHPEGDLLKAMLFYRRQNRVRKLQQTLLKNLKHNYMAL